MIFMASSGTETVRVRSIGVETQGRSFNGNVAASTFSSVVVTKHAGSRCAENQGCKRQAVKCLENDEPGHSFSTDKARVVATLKILS
ncbi:hypothetical protein Tco_1007326 [Tanacetum coccineum]